MNLRLIGDLLLLFGWALPAIAAPVEYAFVRDADGRRFGFRRSAMGKHLMSYMAAVGFLALLGVIRLAFGDSAFWEVLRIAGFVGLIGVTWWRWYVVHQARIASIDDRRERTPLNPPGPPGP